MTGKSYDVVVVGARAAGAATGMLLARAGLDVLVVDRARYGSDTLSTHALLRGGVLQLSRWGLLEEVIAAGTPVVRRTVLRYGDREEVVAIKPQPGCEGLYAPRRFVLDRILADAAFRAGAEVRFGVTAEELLRGPDGRVSGVSLTAAHGRRSRVRAGLVIGADGARSLVARTVRARTTARGRHAGAMVVGWYSGVEADGYQWLYGNAPDGVGRSAGIIPTNDGQVCAWAGVPAPRFGSRRPAQHLAEVLQQIAPDWAARLAGGRRHGPVRGFPGAPWYLRKPWGPGWALVGDSSHFKDPLTTHGLTDALRDAELLARAVVAGHRAPSALPVALAEYEATRDRLSRPLLEVADRVASYAWRMDALRPLLVSMSAAMRPEVEHLAHLPAEGWVMGPGDMGSPHRWLPAAAPAR